MGNLGGILKEHAERLGIKKQVEAVGIVEKATEEIAKYIPRGDFEVVSFKGGALKVCANSASAAAEINQSATQIIKDVADANIKRIIIKIT
jgi:hypothetical protein